MNEQQTCTHGNRSELDNIIDGLKAHHDKPMIRNWTAEESEAWNYEYVGEKVLSLARGLQRRIQPGEAVILLGPDRPPWIIAALAIIRAGGMVTPVDIQLADETLAHVLKDSGANLVFTTTDHQARIVKHAPEAKIALMDVGEQNDNGWLTLADNEGELPVNCADDTAALFYTSGTTGPPKGVPLTHANILFQLETVAESGITRETDHVLLPLPLHHVYPFVVGMLTPVYLGLTLMIPYALTGPQLMRSIHEGQASVIIGVPRLYSALFEGIRGKAVQSGRIASVLFNLLLKLSQFTRERFGLYLGKRLFAPLHRKLGGQLRVLACGGAALDKELAWNLEALGWQVAVGYGLTETSPLLTIDPPGEIHPGTVGQAVRGVSLRIDKVAALRSGIHTSDGEILAQGPSVFEGYLNLPEKSREAFTEDGWFRTGDLGWLDEDGYLHLSGRVSTMIVTPGGENINPEDLEERYADHAAIKEIGILQHQDKLVALIVPDKAFQTDVAPYIREALHDINRKIPSYQQLNDFAITRRPLPRTRLGKIRRKALSEYYQEVISSGGETAEVSPMAPQEMSAEDRGLLDYPAARLAWEWLSQRYPKQGLSPDSSVELDLGMDSLEWLNLTLDLGAQSGVELDEQAIGRIETVRDLLRELIDAGKQADGFADPIRHPEKVINKADHRWLKTRGAGVRLTAGIMYSFNRIMMNTLFSIHVEGLELLPDKGPYILACNHTSSLDPFTVAAVLPNAHLHTLFWGGWTGAAFNNPITRFGSRIVQVIPIDPRRGVRNSLALAASVLERKHGLIWFPEGERSTSGELLEFRPGIGLLLERFTLPVVPVVIHGTHKALPPGKRIPSPGKLDVRFGAPLNPKQLAEKGSGDNPPARIVEALHEKLRRLDAQSRADFKEP